MAIGLIGRKCGMTRLYGDDGLAVPISVVLVEPNRIVQIKDANRDGYSAIQVTTGSKKRSRLSKAEAGHFAEAGVEAGRGLWEFRVSEGAEYSVGSSLGVDVFKEGELVDVRGTSVGKGFAGVVKRHNFRTQDATHGNSLSHRAPGSIGQNQSPGRVFKGKKMAGQMGNASVCVQNLKVYAINVEKSLLLIRGAIPGPSGGDVVISQAKKR